MKWRVGWRQHNDSGWLLINIYAPDGCVYAYTTVYNLPAFCEDYLRNALSDAHNIMKYAHRMMGECPQMKIPIDAHGKLYYTWKYAFEVDV